VLVVDASLAVELSLDRVGEQASAGLDDGGQLIAAAAAPPLLWSEVPSVLHEMAFRGDISNALAELALQRFLAGKLSIGEQRPDGLTTAAWEIAEEFGWAKTTTPSTLRWREPRTCRLVTVDGRLRRGADRLGFVVTPAEL
jgi:predicted nucleic acid-binding protein